MPISSELTSASRAFLNPKNIAIASSAEPATGTHSGEFTCCIATAAVPRTAAREVFQLDFKFIYLSREVMEGLLLLTNPCGRINKWIGNASHAVK